MVRNVSIDDVENVARPLIALGHDYVNGSVLGAHRHRRGQLIFGVDGMLVLATAEGRWVMPPGRGLWIPPGVEHEAQMIGAVSTKILYVDPEAAHVMPDRCQVVGLSPFLRSLIVKAMDVPADYDPAGHGGALMTLIQHEMAQVTELPLSLPFPAHAALADRCRRFLAAPAVHETIDAWSAELGMSRRSFTRAFRQETGLSFVEWRQQACLVAALPRLAAGEAVTNVAFDLGYDNPAAFTTMFKRVLGASPRIYLKQNG